MATTSAPHPKSSIHMIHHGVGSYIYGSMAGAANVPVLPPTRAALRHRKRLLAPTTPANADTERERLPRNIAALQAVTLRIRVDATTIATMLKASPKLSPHDVPYVLDVEDSSRNQRWHFARSVQDYKRFQHQLLMALDHGHVCQATCPWLFSFVKSYFPRKHMFHFGLSRGIAARQAALERFVTTLQTFVTDRANYQCNVVANGVAEAMVDFVYGERRLRLFNDLMLVAPTTTLTPTPTVGSSPPVQDNRRSLSYSCSISSTSEEDDTSSSIAVSLSNNGSVVGSRLCLLCSSSLEGEAYASSASASSVSCGSLPEHASSEIALLTTACSSLPAFPVYHGYKGRASAPTVSYYVTTLGCGHQFHDECIVPKLNETMQCPICGHDEGNGGLYD